MHLSSDWLLRLSIRIIYFSPFLALKVPFLFYHKLFLVFLCSMVERVTNWLEIIVSLHTATKQRRFMMSQYKWWSMTTMTPSWPSWSWSSWCPWSHIWHWVLEHISWHHWIWLSGCWLSDIKLEINWHIVSSVGVTPSKIFTNICVGYPSK